MWSGLNRSHAPANSRHRPNQKTFCYSGVLELPASKGPITALRGNGEYDWAAFEPESYFEHYYADPHPDDDDLTRLAAATLMHAAPDGDGLNIIDIGTGPSLIPFMCAAPRAASLTCWEFSQANVSWLREELSRSETRPQWLHFWSSVRAVYQGKKKLPADPGPLLQAKCEFAQRSIFDLPERRWDAATMFFCAESITEKRPEFEAACASFAKCVKPGGTLAAAFLVRSSGYTVGQRRYPAIDLCASAIEDVFCGLTASAEVQQIGAAEHEVRSGYTGALFLRAQSR